MGDDLKKRKMIDLGWLEGDIYFVLLYGFGDDSGVDLTVIFVKVCEIFDW